MGQVEPLLSPFNDLNDDLSTNASLRPKGRQEDTLLVLPGAVELGHVPWR